MSTNRKRAHTPGQHGRSKQKRGDRESLEVVCRLTPYDGADPCLLLVDENTVECSPPNGVLQRNGQPYADKTYEFGRVFDETDTQREVFNRCSVDLIEHLLTGKNALLFTYGVTGSGKTYTMTGSPRSGQMGILPRTLDTIFNSIDGNIAEKCIFFPTGKNTFDIRTKEEAREERRNQRLNLEELGDERRFVENKRVDGFPEDYVCAVFASYVEIYNNYCYDLLDNGPLDESPPSLDMHMDTNRSVYVGRVREIEVATAEEALALLAQGDNRRRVCDTLLNKESSRSHSVFSIRLVMAPTEGYTLYPINDASRIVTGQLSLVDLAGSERAKRTLNTGVALNEAAKINQSLMTLRLCFEKLRKNQRSTLQESVPYRDTKLTYLFKNFFEGAGKVRMIICANPKPDDYEENIGVLAFAEESQAVQTTKGVDRLEKAAGARLPVPRKFYAQWNGEMDARRPGSLASELETLDWEEYSKKKKDTTVVFDHALELDRVQRMRDDETFDILTTLGEGLRGRLCVSDYDGTVIEEYKRQEEQLNDERAEDAALIKRLKRENNALRSRLAVYEEDNGDRIEMEKEMRRAREDESARVRTQRARVERTLEIANGGGGGGGGPSVASLRNKFNPAPNNERIESRPAREPREAKGGATRNGYYNPKHRRSQSASRVLDHQPNYRIPTGNILRPKMPSNSKSTTAPKAGDIRNSSAYLLTHQEIDDEGNVSTSVIKGDCIPTAGGGTAVCFSDIERLVHKSPTKTTTRL